MKLRRILFWKWNFFSPEKLIFEKTKNSFRQNQELNWFPKTLLNVFYEFE